MSHDLRNRSSRCSMDKILTDDSRRGTQRERNQVKKSGIIEKKKAPEKKREGKGKETGVATKRKKKRLSAGAVWPAVHARSSFLLPLRPSRHPLRTFHPLLLLLRVSASSRSTVSSKVRFSPRKRRISPCYFPLRKISRL